jgi:hypothetical protein
MRVSAAPFAGHASGGPPPVAHVREAELRGGHLGRAAKADDLQLKVRRTLRQLVEKFAENLDDVKSSFGLCIALTTAAAAVLPENIATKSQRIG